MSQQECQGVLLCSVPKCKHILLVSTYVPTTILFWSLIFFAPIYKFFVFCLCEQKCEIWHATDFVLLLYFFWFSLLLLHFVQICSLIVTLKFHQSAFVELC
jgi:hypothetical protein